jgi:hypothetical protein
MYHTARLIDILIHNYCTVAPDLRKGANETFTVYVQQVLRDFLLTESSGYGYVVQYALYRYCGRIEDLPELPNFDLRADQSLPAKK